MQSTGFELRYADRDEPVTLAMQRLWLTGQILPVGARLFVRHDFRHDEDQNLEVIYSFMLPRDAALRKFEVVGDGFEAHSELRRVEEAVREYEEGLEAGHLATLARSYRDGVVNLSLGNLRKGQDVRVTLEIMAGVELTDEGLRFRFPFTIAPGYHAQARMIDTGEGGEIELPSSEFGDVILPTFQRSAAGLHDVGFDLGLRLGGEVAEISSPSHAVRMRKENGAWRVSLSPAGDLPNRDLVLDVRLEQAGAQVLSGEKRFALAVPSSLFGKSENGPRKIAFVVDRSGSMQGVPMTQAKRAVEACLAALAPEDKFALVAFDDRVETSNDRLVAPTASERAKAAKFLSHVHARGGTELAAGFAAGAKIVGEGGFVLVVTDGQVMGTEEILAQARKQNVRIFCLGIGSASQDRFLALLAEATGGVSRFVTPKERVDIAAVDLFASIAPPVAAGVELTGADFAVLPPVTVHAGVPWVAFGERDAPGEVVASWPGGRIAFDIPAPDPAVADAVRLLEGSRRITDLESRMTPGAEKSLTDQLVALSEEYGLASRACSLVAVIKQEGDQAGALPATRVIPVGMPDDTEFDSYFGAPVMAGGPVMMSAPAAPGIVRRRLADLSGETNAKMTRSTLPKTSRPSLMRKAMDFVEGITAPPASKSAPIKELVMEADSASMYGDEDRLLALASSLETDGGVPGSTPDDRALKTIAALIQFHAAGHTPTQGVFRAHVKRMAAFLEALTGLPGDRSQIVAWVIDALRGDGGKLAAAPDGAVTWEELERLADG
ncbi:marine proteobacterial sortase target protein [Capsulimonas corticalis]|uniref:Marine proteobacterial sortase target protein n=1 Tax=Capsulimonas corticalis TaxID=2219043 RepID=A0A402CSE5_9BACT|nr:VIT and VWA domain-containing protein [Capsulimonas corticalis]BDI31109.1 marine proteobacterial sortase target protein [Capsulimonas corticalis]